GGSSARIAIRSETRGTAGCRCTTTTAPSAPTAAAGGGRDRGRGRESPVARLAIRGRSKRVIDRRSSVVARTRELPLGYRSRRNRFPGLPYTPKERRAALLRDRGSTTGDPG